MGLSRNGAQLVDGYVVVVVVEAVLADIIEIPQRVAPAACDPIPMVIAALRRLDPTVSSAVAPLTERFDVLG